MIGARGALAAATLLLLFTATARAEDFPCLWLSLTTSDRARLELDAEIGGKPLETIFKRRGERAFAQYLQECGVALRPETVLRVGHYLHARAAAEIAQARLSATGVTEKALVAALDAEATPSDRRLWAKEMMGLGREAGVEGRGAPAMSAAAARISARIATADTAPETARLLKTWAIHRIIADGVKAGAAPPSP